MGVAEHRFKVLCRDKGRRGGNRERHVQECVLTNDGCICSCHKPRLLHKACTHVIAACAEAGDLVPRRYVSQYYMKETIMHTWHNEVYGFGILGTFTSNPGPAALYIPDPEKKQKKKGRRKTALIRNDMDESEAGPQVVICSKCNEPGHTYKNCKKDFNTIESGPSGISDAGSRARPRRQRGVDDYAV